MIKLILKESEAMKNTSNILKFAAFAAIVSVAFSCVREEIEAPAPSGEKFTLEVSLEPQLKTTLGSSDGSGERKVYWSDGDKIAVNGIASEALENLPDNTQSTIFTFSDVLSTPYNVLYPASAYVDATHINLPAKQEYKSGSFDDGMSPMAGYSADGSSLSLKHLCAVLHISVKRSADAADTDNLLAVRFKGKAGEQVCGSFSIDYANAALTENSSADADKEVRVVTRKTTSVDTPVEYYIVVPARTYANGFEVIVQDENNHIMTKSKSASTTLVAGKLYNMTEFDFVPSGTETGIEIANAEDMIAFAKAYNNNEYEALGVSLVATVVQDITFNATTSAAFNATGGIGTADDGNGGTNYFNGTLEGNGHAISDLVATVPVVAYTGSGGVVKDLTLASSCSYTVETSSGSNHGALVGRNKGTVKDCTSAASVIINNIQDMDTATQYYGGLVGYNYGGTVDGCTVTGNITCSQTGQTIKANTASIGGIVGYQSSDGGTINNCTFEGNITVSDGSTYGGITANGRSFYLGGILAYGNKAAITNCTAGIDGTSTAIDARGAFVPAIGGIVGWIVNSASSEVTGCYNYMSLSFASNGARANTTPCRIGGIAARSAASISSSQNFGAIASTCNSTTLYLAGIVAEGAGIDHCVNNATGTVTRTNADQTANQANRYMYIGGIMGTNLAACDVTDCTNNAAVLSNAIGTATQTTIDISGIVASAGSTTPTQIDIVSCENNGTVTLTNNGTVVTTRLTVAGILGYCAAANSTIESCDNKAQIYCNSQKGADGRVSYSGGIVGLMGSFAAGVEGLEIKNCTNSARVWNRSYNNTVTPASSTPFGGGIVGAIVGTTSSKANVHDCSTAGGDVVELRGYCGGIAGYAQDATIKDNTVAQAMTASNANSQGAGGLVGWAVSTAISGCSTSASINNVKNIGGLVAKLDTGSSIENCEVNGATLTKGTHAAATEAAVLVSDAADGVTITGCGIKGTLNSAAITLSSNMITTDGGATVTGTYLLP